MEESNFNRLLERYVAGKATPGEKAKIELWFEVRKTSDSFDTGLTDDEKEDLFRKISANIDNDEEIRTFRPLAALHHQRRTLALRIAASILLLATLSLAVFSIVQRTSPGDVEKVILNDGSIVWLRPQSKFAYFESPTDATRNGELHGEGLFEIAKDPNRPFLIRHGNVTLRVLGTSFSLKTAHDTLELKVLTGKVTLSSPTNTEGIVVTPNETALCINTAITKSTLTPTQKQQVVALAQYNMQFTNAPLTDVVDRIAEKFDVEIRLTNDSLAKCLITADFTDQSLESTLQMMTEVINASFKKQKNHIEINGPGC